MLNTGCPDWPCLQGGVSDPNLQPGLPSCLDWLFSGSLWALSRMCVYHCLAELTLCPSSPGGISKGLRALCMWLGRALGVFVFVTGKSEFCTGLSPPSLRRWSGKVFGLKSSSLAFQTCASSPQTLHSVPLELQLSLASLTMTCIYSALPLTNVLLLSSTLNTTQIDRPPLPEPKLTTENNPPEEQQNNNPPVCWKLPAFTHQLAAKF